MVRQLKLSTAYLALTIRANTVQRDVARVERFLVSETGFITTNT
jgi:hypothetical protein